MIFFVIIAIATNRRPRARLLDPVRKFVKIRQPQKNGFLFSCINKIIPYLTRSRLTSLIKGNAYPLQQQQRSAFFFTLTLHNMNNIHIYTPTQTHSSPTAKPCIPKHGHEPFPQQRTRPKVPFETVPTTGALRGIRDPPTSFHSGVLRPPAATQTLADSGVPWTFS